MVQEKQMPPTASRATADSDSPRSRALLPADAGGTFVNGLRKTNAAYGVACFSFGPIIYYTLENYNLCGMGRLDERALNAYTYIIRMPQKGAWKEGFKYVSGL